MKLKNIDLLVLGCTHYPFLQKMIEEYMGPNVKIINPAYETAEEVSRIIGEIGQTYNRNNQVSKAERKYFVTDALTRFVKFGSRFLGFKITDTEKIYSLI